MKLHRESTPRRTKADEALRLEAGPEFDLRRLVLGKAKEMERAVLVGSQDIDPIEYERGFLWQLGSVTVIEQGMGVQLIDPVKRKKVFDPISHQISFTLPPSKYVRDWGIHPHILAQLAGWVQSYPDEREKAQREIQGRQYEDIVRTITRRSNTGGHLRMVALLLQLRPDERERIQALAPQTYFQTQIVDKQKAQYLLPGRNIEMYVRWLADYLTIHPEDRQQFSLSQAEQEMIEHNLQKPENAFFPTVGKLRDAAIIFAEDAKVDERGVIQITYPPRQIQSARPELPVRPAI